jgi:hypothetical protein
LGEPPTLRVAVALSAPAPPSLRSVGASASIALARAASRRARGAKKYTNIKTRYSASLHFPLFFPLSFSYFFNSCFFIQHIMQTPNTAEYSPYYSTYIKNVPDGNLIQTLQSVHQKTQLILRDVAEEKGNYAYEEGKWTLKQVLQHLIDTERIMAYRALRIGRGDTTPLLGYDENAFAAHARVAHLRIEELIGEWYMLRLTTIQLFSRFTEEESQIVGTANGEAVSVRALAYIIVGHEIHHLSALQQNYL